MINQTSRSLPQIFSFLPDTEYTTNVRSLGVAILFQYFQRTLSL